MIRPIHPGLAPNEEKVDFLLALSKLFSFTTYNSGVRTKELEKWFENFYHEKAFAFASGRGALFAVLTNLGLPENSEVIIPAFTCVAVVDAILAAGLRPLYVDITKDFVYDIQDVNQKISKTSKVIVLQHTFGITNATSEILSFAKKHNLLIIEDCAHEVGLEERNKLLGTYGVAAIFSFGRDKAFSSVSGGIAITSDSSLSKKLQKFQDAQEKSSSLWALQNLFHIVSFYSLILPLYDFFSLGKFFLVLFQKIGLLSKPIDASELDHFALYSRQLSPVLAEIVISQLQRLEKFNRRRKEYVSFYQHELKQNMPEGALLRFPILVNDPNTVKEFARKENVYLGDWYSNGIDPKGTNVPSLGYEKGMCPTAEYIASHVINLPTYPTLSQKNAEKVVTIIKKYVNN